LARRTRAGVARAARGRRIQVDDLTTKSLTVLDVRYPNLLSKRIIQEICVSPDGAVAPGFSVPAA
jgi:hypothetical protein